MRGLAAVALAASLLLAPALAQSQEPAKTREILQRASDTLKNAKRLSFHAEINFDTEPTPGLFVQLAGAVDVKLRRPDRLQVEYRDDGAAKSLWYDGRTLTLLDWPAGVFATYPAPATVDETTARVRERLGLRLPLAGLVSSNPAGKLLAGALRGTYVGLDDVEGVPCHHLAFLQEDVDWEIWIEDGAVAVPRKLLIRYKQVRGWPQYSAVLMDWEIDPELDDAAFVAKLPKDAVKVEFIEVRAQQ